MTGRTVLITGASGAIGSATAQAFLDAGLSVIGIDVTPPAGPGRAGLRSVVADLRDASRLANELDRAIGTGVLAHVIALAGGALPWEPETQDDPSGIDAASFMETIEANLLTQFNTVQAALPYMSGETEADRSISLTSSFNALSAQGMPGYSAAKAALTGMMHGLVVPLGRQGIRINVVAPGTVRTPRTERIWAHREGHFERLEESTALGRLARPEDVAQVFLGVATMFRHVTGQVIVVDGGQMVVHR
jgi:NAD(P)-dependent dehydrogenase (short-subunit alcohol dehydrogenase family)